MVVLVFGILLWSFAHLFKRIAPTYRAKLGDTGKGLIALSLIVSVALMVFGFQGTRTVDLLPLHPYARHLNQIMMCVAIYLLAAASLRSWLTGILRHPMLWGVVLWGAAHLIVNNDMASIVLFGGMILWAVVEMILINRGEPLWDKPERSSAIKELVVIAGSVVALAAISYIHNLLGYPPFG